MKKLLFIVVLIIDFTKIYSQDTVFQIRYQLDYKCEKQGEGELLDSNSIQNPTSKNLILQLQTDGSFKTSEENKILKKYDFKTEMIFIYNTDTLYNTVPLHSVIDYRITEYKNRIFLSDMLQAGGVESAFGDLANLESIFGIENKNNNIKDSIKISAVENTKIYSFSNNELVRIRFSKTRISNDFLESFAKFLTYTTEIHPSIKKEIVKTKLVPEYIQYNYVNVAIKTTKTYLLQESKKIGALPENVFNKDQIMFQRNTSPMAGLIDSMMNYTTLNKVQPIDSMFYFNESYNLSKNDENLSGLLSLFEYLLSSGNQPVNQFRKILPKQASDTLLTTFLFCLNSPNSKEEAESKISKLNSLIDLDLKYGYIMNIFAANYVEPIDQFEAISYFYKALSKKPEITGAWLDLGKIYANKYHFKDAWKCYEIMLQINSNHPMAKEVIEKKEKLTHNYPEYFKEN